jgi:hypothetical protein
MDKKLQKLAAMGAGDFEHVDGKLIDHLFATRDLLKAWSASEILQDAGLYHAAYGTAGFNEDLVNISQRKKIAEIIGQQAEDIVYQYCACARAFFWPKIGVETKPNFKDRFTGEVYLIEEDMLQNFCELTVANELELAIDNSAFVLEHGQFLYALFVKMGDFISQPARALVEQVLAENHDCHYLDKE